MQRYARLSLGRALFQSRPKTASRFYLAPFIRFLACEQVKRGAPAHAVGLPSPPLPPARSRVPSRSVFRQGQASAIRRPCLSLRVPSSPRASASARRVGSALPLGSNHRRGSLRLCTASPRPTRFPPWQALFRFRSSAGGLSLVRGFAPRRSGGRVPRPPAVKGIFVTLNIRTCVYRVLFYHPPPAYQGGGAGSVLTEGNADTNRGFLQMG